MGRVRDLYKGLDPMDRKEIGCEDVDWINPAQDRVQILAVKDLHASQKREVSRRAEWPCDLWILLEFPGMAHQSPGSK